MTIVASEVSSKREPPMDSKKNKPKKQEKANDQVGPGATEQRKVAPPAKPDVRDYPCERPRY